jgi:hypothetical protein
MEFRGKLKVGDLVRVREFERGAEIAAHRLGLALVLAVEQSDQPRRFPLVKLRFLKTEKVMRFVEKDLMLIHGA